MLDTNASLKESSWTFSNRISSSCSKRKRREAKVSATSIRREPGCWDRCLGGLSPFRFQIGQKINQNHAPRFWIAEENTGVLSTQCLQNALCHSNQLSLALAVLSKKMLHKYLEISSSMLNSFLVRWLTHKLRLTQCSFPH